MHIVAIRVLVWIAIFVEYADLIVCKYFTIYITAMESMHEAAVILVIIAVDDHMPKREQLVISLIKKRKNGSAQIAEDDITIAMSPILIIIDIGLKDIPVSRF